jgi:hypothetical protein
MAQLTSQRRRARRASVALCFIPAAILFLELEPCFGIRSQGGEGGLERGVLEQFVTGPVGVFSPD